MDEDYWMDGRQVDGMPVHSLFAWQQLLAWQADLCTSLSHHVHEVLRSMSMGHLQLTAGYVQLLAACILRAYAH